MANNKGKMSKYLKLIPFAITAILVVMCLVFLKNISFKTIMNIAPDNVTLTIIVILLLYAFKSLSIIFPLTILFVAAGAMFPLWGAIVISFIGLMVSLTIPWAVGRWSGAEALETLSQKYPKMAELRRLGQNNKLFLSFILRAVAIVPGDVASMMLGAAQIPYLPYIIGSQLGLLPGMLLQTMIGNALNHQFTWQMGALFVVLMLACFIVSFLCNKNLKKKNFSKK